MVATLPNVRRYVNDYCCAYEVADGQVTAIR
jgi:ketosteroid isomerase-like protein